MRSSQPCLAAGVDPAAFTRTLSHFATGLTIVTGAAPMGPVGMTCQAFCSVSLEPPLVLFCARNGSTTGRVICETGAYSVNLLGKDQQWIAERMAAVDAGGDRFTGIDWRPSDLTGCPVLAGTIAHIDCEVRDVHTAGDHSIYVGQVIGTGSGEADAGPLIYYRSAYG
ncbi:flavin reductase family protein [Streptomyces sp. NBC_00445]|uniref:flavin reductase family protein n=1 Tax=unclassified Streptomyces TaxID=2593676 RepID=UPI002E1EEBD1|nr:MULTISPECIES: flavin reductase family protein [unclassified Streptomyces]